MNVAMLSDFSSLFEVITAVYFSMCIDDVLKEVWTPEYKSQVSHTIENSNVALVKCMVVDFKNYIDKIVDKIRRHMKIKSTLMLLMCLTVLLFMGFHNQISSWGIDETELIVRFSILVLVSQIFSKFLLCKFSRAVLSTIGIWAITILSFCFEFAIGCSYTVAITILLCTFLWPIVWQVIRCWASSSLYYGFIKEKMQEESYMYDLAMLGYRNDKIDVVPECYRESVVREIEDSKSTNNPADGSDAKSDASLRYINKMFISRMELICKQTNTLFLIWMDIRHHFKTWLGSNKGQFISDSVIAERVFKSTMNTNLPLFDEHKSII